MSIYKECDIRGIYGEEFDEKDAFEISRAIGSILAGKQVVVCGDIRISTPMLKRALIDGLVASGANVVDIGIQPTPVFYFAKSYLNADGGVMVTASHNPWQYNGYKVILGDLPVRVEDIREIERRALQMDYTNGEGSYRRQDVEHDYIKFLHRYIKRGGGRVVIDAGGGVTSRLAPQLFREFGYDVVELFCEFDGKFSKRDPNPAVYSHLAKLQEKVIETNADFGAAFDGDGDRVVFVDEMGGVVTSERSLCIFISEYMKDNPSSVVYDLKSSAIVKKTTEDMGGKAIMERSGHTFIKTTFLKKCSALAGEISGHFFFAELGYDDGIYAALKMGEIIAESGETLRQKAERFPLTVITPDIRIHWPYETRDGLLETIKRGLGKQYELSFLDGIRVDFGYGWLLVRKSVTEEGITLRIEADNESKMKQIINILLTVVPELKGRVRF